MSYGQKEIGERFHRGESSGKASNVEIQEFEALGLTAVVGYGHAVYATRDIETGHTVYFDGWYGYSVTTSCQISKMRLESNADEVVSTKKQVRDLEHQNDVAVRQQ